MGINKSLKANTNNSHNNNIITIETWSLQISSTTWNRLLPPTTDSSTMTSSPKSLSLPTALSPALTKSISLTTIAATCTMTIGSVAIRSSSASTAQSASSASDTRISNFDNKMDSIYCGAKVAATYCSGDWN